MRTLHPAHIRLDNNKNMIIQTAADHSRKTADYTANNLRSVGLFTTGYLMGLLHDMGKFTEKFKTYIEKAAKNEDVQRGSVNHTFAGVIYLFEKYHKANCTDMTDITCEFIACAIGSHHGVYDCISPEGTDGFMHRLMKDRSELCYDEAIQNFFIECTKENEISSLFEASQKEMQVFIERVAAANNKEKEPFSFAVGMAERLLLSALIDGDRRDTAMFMNGIEVEHIVTDTREQWENRLRFAERKISEFKQKNDIDITRHKISERCKAFADRPGGIYRLTVPTGAGKTLSALRYALAHAAQYEKKRIFFIIPLLSVIEQNAKVLREYIADEELLLEHHSNIIKPVSGDGELSKYELLAESWESPVVISTLVQLLDTLFSDKTTCIRRMHALVNSVLIIDEIQSLPRKSISLMNGAINFLTQLCGVTVILCSATQPCFEQVAHPLRLGKSPDMVPYDKELWKVFERTKIIDWCTDAGYTYEETAGLSMELMSAVNSLLIVCNTKAAARELYQLLDVMNRSTAQPFLLFHLSAAMCTKHRSDTLDSIKANLGKNRVVCVSTQLVEAGVDFSFESVVRVRAGLDNIAQAAGRCNRSGEFHRICPVYVVNLRNESLSALKEIKDSQEAAKSFMYRYAQDSETFGGDMLSAKSIEAYYKILYADRSVSNKFDYPVPELDSSIIDMLSANSVFVSRNKENRGYLIRQAFKTAGESFKVFDDNTIDAIVPYDVKAEELIADLYSEKAKFDLGFLSGKLKEAKPYTVSLFEYQRRRLDDLGGLHGDREMPFLSVLPRFYNKETGLDIEGTL